MGPGQKNAPIINTREGRRTQPAKPLNPVAQRKPLSRPAKFALGALALLLGGGGLLWTASQTFPVIGDEIAAYTVLRCTATSQCVPRGDGECWNKPAAAIHAIVNFENPVPVLNSGRASSCICEVNLCLMHTQDRIHAPGTVPAPGK